MNQKFTDGSIVYLNTGSPAMTISSFHKPTQRYRCDWFVGEKPEFGEYPETSLVSEKPSIH
jgi:uncharacterized protein YodC (DUF2158 family)